MMQGHLAETQDGRVNVVANLCEDLRQGHDPETRIRAELSRLEVALRRRERNEELGFLKRLQVTRIHIQPGSTDHMGA
jgi:hypothetical protein